MLAYLINLAERTDRLMRAQAEFDRIGVKFTRIAAIDKNNAARGLEDYKLRPFPSFTLTDGEKACLLSHFKAWTEFLATQEQHCLILEDDVVPSAALKDFLDHFNPKGLKANTIRLETYLRLVSLSRSPTLRVGNIVIHKIHSSHWGAASYIMSRAFAKRVLEAPSLPLLPADHLLFDPISPFFDNQRTYQAVPALCIQGDRIAPLQDQEIFDSDIQSERAIYIRHKKSRKPKGLNARLHRRWQRWKRKFDLINRWLGLRQWTTVAFAGDVEASARAVQTSTREEQFEGAAL
jgi:glycosyl transferase, family 25